MILIDLALFIAVWALMNRVEKLEDEVRNMKGKVGERD